MNALLQYNMHIMYVCVRESAACCECVYIYCSMLCVLSCVCGVCVCVCVCVQCVACCECVCIVCMCMCVTCYTSWYVGVYVYHAVCVYV